MTENHGILSKFTRRVRGSDRALSRHDQHTTDACWAWLQPWQALTDWPWPTAVDDAAAHLLDCRHVAAQYGEHRYAHAHDDHIAHVLATIIRSLPTAVHAAAVAGNEVTTAAIETALFVAVAADPAAVRATADTAAAWANVALDDAL